MQVNLVVAWNATILFCLTKIVESVQLVEALLELLDITPAGAHLLEWSWEVGVVVLHTCLGSWKWQSLNVELEQKNPSQFTHVEFRTLLESVLRQFVEMV